MIQVAHSEAVEFLKSSKVIRLDLYDLAGNLIGVVGWRYYYTETKYGLKSTDETGEVFHILKDKVKQWGLQGNTLWAVYELRVLVYTRIE